VPANEPLELGNELCVTSEREIGVDALLERGEPLLVQPQTRVTCKRGIELGEGSASPESQRLGQQLGRLDRGRTLCLRHPSLEALEVELGVAKSDQVPGRLGDDHVRSEGLSQLRHVNLDRSRRGVGRLATPQLVDEPVA
jgi:hypothetical protein